MRTIFTALLVLVIGATIEAFAPGRTKRLGRRDVVADCMRGSHKPSAHFGLGENSSALVRIRLQKGRTPQIADVRTDQVVTIAVDARRVRAAGAQ